MADTTLSNHIDVIYKKLGVWGKWQVGQVALLMSLYIPAAFQLLSVVFIGYQPDFRCAPPKADPTPGEVTPASPQYGTKCYSNSSEVSTCPGGVQYNKVSGLRTIVTEWDLVCDKSFQAQLTQTVLIIGQAVGATLFTSLADRYGRTWVCALCQLGLMAAGIGTAFAPNIVVFTLLRLPLGAFQQSLIMTATVLPMEIIPMEQRTLVHMISGMSWAASQALLVGVAYAFQEESWRHLQLALCSASLFLAVFHYLFIDESLRWLLANDRISTAKGIVRQASRLNNIKAPEAEVDDVASLSGSEVTRLSLTSLATVSGGTGRSSSNLHVSEGTSHTDVSQLKFTVLDIFRSPQLRCTTLVLAFAWMVNALVYFGLSLTSSKLAGNRFLNFFLLVVVEFPAAIITYFTMKRPGRRMTCVIFHGIAGLSMILAASLKATQDKSLSTYVTVMSLLGKFAIASSWLCLFNYTTELYPTNARSIGLGFASSASRIGGMVAPFTNLAPDELGWLPGSIFGVSSLVVCGLMLFVPETCDKALPQNLGDILLWNHRPPCCGSQTETTCCSDTNVAGKRYPRANIEVNRYPRTNTEANRYPRSNTEVNRYPRSNTEANRYPRTTAGVNQHPHTNGETGHHSYDNILGLYSSTC